MGRSGCRADRWGPNPPVLETGRAARPRPCRDETLIAEDAAALGAQAHVARAAQIVTEGTSADRQLAAYERLRTGGAHHETALKGVVDHLASETLAI